MYVKVQVEKFLILNADRLIVYNSKTGAVIVYNTEIGAG